MPVLLAQRKLAYRLISFITLFGILITIVSTAIQVKLEYNRELADIRERFTQVQKSYLQSIAENLWLLDGKRLQTILEGISSLPDFQFAQVVSENGEVKALIGETRDTGTVILSADIPYIHRGQPRIIGRFQLVANLDGALERVTREVGFVLSSIAVVIFSFAVIIYVAVHWVMTRHMSKMADYARNFSMENIDQALVLDRSGDQRRDDELKDMVTAINEMRLNLKHSYEELQFLNAELETRVADRTRDLTEEIAERKKALDRLQQALSLNETILEASPIGIAIYNEQGQCVVANVAIREIFGDTRDDFLKQNFKKADGWINPGFSDLALWAMEENLPKSHEYNCQTTDGRDIDVECHMVPFLSGRETHLMWLAIDISERKMLQSQLIQSSKMATLGEMATGVAHELNQPLQIIRMAVSNIKRKIEKGKLDAGYINGKLMRVDTQTARASSIIDHMSVFGHKSTAVKEKIDLNNSVHSVLDMIEEQLKEVDVEVEVSLPDRPCHILGHEVQVEQVLINLIGNARDAILENAPSDEKRILIDLKSSSDGSPTILSVSDTGGGIPENLIDRVFEPFFTTKEVGEGTGLGLSIIYGIIQDMGGDIKADNIEKGARFTISLTPYE